MSAARIVSPIRRAISPSRRSPAAWPRLSLTDLKSSRSIRKTVTGRCARAPRTSACSSRSPKRARFARPVRPSWNAWWRRRSSSALRSLTSQILTTIPFQRSSPSRLVARASQVRRLPSRWRRRSSRAGPPRVGAGGKRGQNRGVVGVQPLGQLPCLRAPPARSRASPAPPPPRRGSVISGERTVIMSEPWRTSAFRRRSLWRRARSSASAPACRRRAIETPIITATSRMPTPPVIASEPS